ncbi:hypothetical protein AVEN_251478-1 [Araneus ventricosus]|uniref:Uncharacterized protein n=1 Tax=Araneus ventricosus TaxID=182803 RepID=A0A4Y2RMD8_ARAVE|nr:hypothetical protein AVEN_251478-1 [Araneus ventricosus]
MVKFGSCTNKPQNQIKSNQMETECASRTAISVICPSWLSPGSRSFACISMQEKATRSPDLKPTGHLSKRCTNMSSASSIFKRFMQILTDVWLIITPKQFHRLVESRCCYAISVIKPDGWLIICLFVCI